MQARKQEGLKKHTRGRYRSCSGDIMILGDWPCGCNKRNELWVVLRSPSSVGKKNYAGDIRTMVSDIQISLSKVLWADISGSKLARKFIRKFRSYPVVIQRM